MYDVDVPTTHPASRGFPDLQVTADQGIVSLPVMSAADHAHSCQFSLGAELTQIVKVSRGVEGAFNRRIREGWGAKGPKAQEGVVIETRLPFFVFAPSLVPVKAIFLCEQD
jgi:hypothetical protein